MEETGSRWIFTLSIKPFHPFAFLFLYQFYCASGHVQRLRWHSVQQWHRELVMHWRTGLAGTAAVRSGAPWLEAGGTFLTSWLRGIRPQHIWKGRRAVHVTAEACWAADFSEFYNILCKTTEPLAPLGFVAPLECGSWLGFLLHMCTQGFALNSIILY